MKKKGLIILIVVIVVLLLAAGGVTFAYMTTDFLKSDEELFYKYMGQAVGELKNYKSQEMIDYFNKLKNTPYENSGKLTAKVEIPEEMKASYPDIEKVNAANITFSGKIDKRNNNAEESIQMNYAEGVTLPIEYRQTGTLCGITSGSILKKYIAVKTDDLDGLAQKFGETDEQNVSIPSFDNVNITEEKVAEEAEIFKNIIKNNISKENFSKTEDRKLCFKFKWNTASKYFNTNTSRSKKL